MATRILFLAAEMQPFLASGVRSLLDNNDVEIIIYCRQRAENKLIDIDPNERLRIFTYDYEPDTFFWKTIELFKPDLVFCAGWMFNMFLSWSKALRRRGAKTICAMDTQWKGMLKQRLLIIAAPFTIRKYFTNAWVPGNRQEDYAIRLGFSKESVLQHLYAPDTALFGNAYSRQSNSGGFQKIFLYAGRLEPHKLKNLLLAFHALSDAERGAWRLKIIGNGSMETGPLLKHKAIDYGPARTQKGLAELAAEGGVFCLCSVAEPWGTVVQEFAAAGLPLLLSQQCGASDQFLKNNGILCDGASVESIGTALRKFIHFTDDELLQMSQRSHRLGMITNSAIWAKELMSLA